MTDENCYQLWEVRTAFDKPCDEYVKYYSSIEHLAVNEIIVLLKGGVGFKQHIQKNTNGLGWKSTNYTCMILLDISII
jgi:hypothetical protein